jgi:hypothetical protein
MQSPLDLAITAAAAAEATYTADVQNVVAIQASIDAATSPLASAQAQMAADAKLFNLSLDALSAAALATEVSIPLALVPVIPAAAPSTLQP